jgi:hypothetical protein
MLRNKTQTCWIYSLYRSWKIAIGPVLIPGPSSVYGKANHQGARAKGYQADGWTWDQCREATDQKKLK